VCRVAELTSEVIRQGIFKFFFAGFLNGLLPSSTRSNSATKGLPCVGGESHFGIQAPGTSRGWNSLGCGVEKPPALRQLVRVKLKVPILLLLAATILAGCAKPAPPAPKPQTIDDLLPKQAQPKLRTMKLYIGDFPSIKTLDAELALTSEEIMTGMMYRTNIQETDAMFFLLPHAQRANFWMKNCPESISAAYITPEGVIAEIHRLEANNTNGVFSATDNIRFVLETKEGWFERNFIGVGMVIRTEKGSLAETFLQR
jgi:uncharacterized membrane protein (UPF0127 family)